MLKPFLIGSAALTALVFGTAVLHAQEGSDTVPPEVDGMEEVVEEGMSPEVAEEGMSPEVVEEGVSSEVIEDGVPSEVVEDGTSPEVEDGISSEVVEDEVSSDIDLPEIDTDPSAQVPDNLMDSPEAEMFVSKGVEPANTVAQNDSELSGDPTSEGEAIAAEDISEAELQQIAATVADLDEIAAEARTKIDEAIAESGLSKERFVEIYQTTRSPELQVDADISPEEAAQFQQASAEVEAVEREILEQQQQTIVEAGYELAEFQAIVALIRQDPELSQQLEQVQ